MNAALTITAADLTTALCSATFGQSAPVRYVETPAGERVGWIRQSGPDLEWWSGSSGGWAKDEAAALAAIEEAVLRHRRLAAIDRARIAEVESLPEPLRTLRIERDRAAMRLELERTRNVRNEGDLRRAEQALAAAELAYAAAETKLAEAA